MRDNKTNWLYVEFGIRGEKEEVKWVNDKTFDEIVKIGEEEYEGVEYMFYRESVVRELIGVDLDKLNEEGWKMVGNVIDRVYSLGSFEE